jgi:Ca-activated chloride channel family protein
MQFDSPVFLWLSPLALLVAWWWVRRPRPAIRFSDTGLFAGARSRRVRLATWGGAALRGLVCLLLILACAGPRKPDLRTRIPVEGIAIEMVVDVSGSMADRDFVWAADSPLISRLDAARRAIRLFVEGGQAPDGATFEPRPSDPIGLVELSAVPESTCPLTLNHSVLLRKVNELAPREGIQAGTNIGDAIAEAVIRLDATGGRNRKVIVLLSDGQHVQARDGPDAMHRPRAAAQLAANLGFPIYTIDCGGVLPATAGPEALAEREAGRETMRAVAAMTGGRSFTANNGTEFLDAYRDISRIEKSTIESFQYRRYFECYWWCTAAAIVLLFMAHVLDRTWWRVVP